MMKPCQKMKQWWPFNTYFNALFKVAALPLLNKSCARLGFTVSQPCLLIVLYIHTHANIYSTPTQLHTPTVLLLSHYETAHCTVATVFTTRLSCITYSWLISFFDTTASSLKYGTIFAPQQEQKPTGDELSEPATVPRVMPSRAARMEEREAAGVLNFYSSHTVIANCLLDGRDTTESEEIFLEIVTKLKKKVSKS